MTRRGFSISISDEDVSRKAYKRIEKIVEEYDEYAEKMIKDYHGGRMEKVPGMTPQMVLESRILQMGGTFSNQANEIIKGDLPWNSAVMMARTGARGSFVNLTQMCGFVGQETIGGGRISRGYINRTLSVFRPGELSLKSKGFVSHGYKVGLDPIEFFFDAMNSRENLMDKSLHTRHSGYMERRLISALQDLRVEYDGTVRDSKNHVIQFVAGEDCIDPAKSDGGKVNMQRVLG